MSLESKRMCFQLNNYFKSTKEGLIHSVVIMVLLWNFSQSIKKTISMCTINITINRVKPLSNSSVKIDLFVSNPEADIFWNETIEPFVGAPVSQSEHLGHSMEKSTFLSKARKWLSFYDCLPHVRQQLYRSFSFLRLKLWSQNITVNHVVTRSLFQMYTLNTRSGTYST